MAKIMQKRLQEDCVLYYSTEDHCWIAHGLTTDQVGTGDCLVDALADFIKAFDQIVALAKREGDIDILRNAPPATQLQQASAQSLPREFYEIAHKKARGTWPDENKIEINAPLEQRYRYTFRMPVCA